VLAPAAGRIEEPLPSRFRLVHAPYSVAFTIQGCGSDQAHPALGLGALKDTSDRLFTYPCAPGWGIGLWLSGRFALPNAGKRWATRPTCRIVPGGVSGQDRRFDSPITILELGGGARVACARVRDTCEATNPVGSLPPPLLPGGEEEGDG